MTSPPAPSPFGEGDLTFEAQNLYKIPFSKIETGNYIFYKKSLLVKIFK